MEVGNMSIMQQYCAKEVVRMWIGADIFGEVLVPNICMVGVCVTLILDPNVGILLFCC